MIIKTFLFWLPMVVIAFGNALLRESIFANQYSHLRAHQFSTITLLLFCSLYIWFVLPFLKIQKPEEAFLTGFLWVVLTIVFEFGLGRLTNKSWTYLFQDYNLLSGRIWIIFLLGLFFLPYLGYTLRMR